MNIQDIVDAIITFVQTNQAWAAPIVFILAFGESLAFISLLLPFWAMLVGIGSFIGTSSSHFILIWIAASVGAALGDWLSYWLGYHYSDKIAHMWPLSKYPDLLPRGHDFFEKYGVWAVIFGRFSGPFRASIPIIAGTTQMDWKHFQIANWFSAFLWAFVLLMFGDAIGGTVKYLWASLAGS